MTDYDDIQEKVSIKLQSTPVLDYFLQYILRSQNTLP